MHLLDLCLGERDESGIRVVVVCWLMVVHLLEGKEGQWCLVCMCIVFGEKIRWSCGKRPHLCEN